MTDDRGTLRAIAWRELCPWLIIFRTFTLALTLPLLFLATLAVMVQPLGWQASSLIFLSSDTLDADLELKATTQFLQSWPIRYRDGGNFNWPALSAAVDLTSGDAQSIYHRLSLPFRQLFRLDLTLTEFCYFLFGGLWTLLIWAFVGGMITRLAVVYLGREERISFKEALYYVGARYGSYFVAPLYPLIGVMLLAIPIALLGLLMQLDIGVLLAGLLWIFVIIAAVAMAFMLLGLLFGWPLLWPAISAENGDAFEAMSRSYGYTFQRPFHYLFFALVAAIFGALCWFFVSIFADLVVHLAWWGASWGTGVARLKEIQDAAAIHDPEMASTMAAGTWLLNLVNGLVYCVAAGFGYSLFFCLGSAIYLLLRHVDDESELDEVFVEEDEDRFALPQLSRDAAGVPAVETPETGVNEAE
ncbi:MAG TPA: hypothetical protein VL096_01950 [Pirellulaceae bacterium]|nr:hypothetical protein [Pirellulaceae bacterium]